MDLAVQLAEVDRLRLLPFPGRRVRRGTVTSGPGFHLAALAVGEDPHDGDPGLAAQAEDDFRAWCQALVELLSARWGDPETVDLSVFLERAASGGSVPPPLDALCGFVPEVYGWRVGDRWTAVGVGQGDRALPPQLVLAIGERSAYESATGRGPRVIPPRDGRPEDR
jgi:hypothetical protein